MATCGPTRWRTGPSSIARATCQTSKGCRNIHSIVHEGRPGGGRVQNNGDPPTGSDPAKTDQVGIGFGFQSDVRDHRANCFARNNVAAGVEANQLVLGDNRVSAKVDYDQPIQLTLVAKPTDASNETFIVELVVMQQGTPVGRIKASFSAKRVAGNLALLGSLSGKDRDIGASQFAFDDWTIGGAGVGHRPERRFGPILWTMYTMDQDPEPAERPVRGTVQRTGRRTVRLTVLIAPIGDRDKRTVDLQLRIGGQWLAPITADIDPEAWTATFELTDFDATTATDYRAMYHAVNHDGDPLATEIYAGVIRPDPAAENTSDTATSGDAKPRPLRLAALTCQNDYGFPYAPVAENLRRLDADLIYFFGRPNL